MAHQLYAWLGAATGAAYGAAEVGKKEASHLAATTASQVNALLDELQAATDARAHKAAWAIYGAAGAISGLLTGARYAALCLWWWLTEDEIKAKLLQGSPVKYTTKDVAALNGGDRPAEPATDTAEHVHPPPRPPVVVTAPVKSGADHMPEKKEQSKKKGGQNGGHASDISNTTNGTDSSTSISKNGHKHRKPHPAIADGVSLPSPRYHSEENSPRVLAAK